MEGGEGVKFLTDLYWKMYNEHATQARHHETLRASVSTILVAVSAGLVSIYSALKLNTPPSNGREFGFVLIALGVLGCLVSYKHYERNRLHTKILGAYAEEISRLAEASCGESLIKPNADAREDHEAEYPISSLWLSAHVLWMAVFLFVIVGGVLILKGQV